MGSIGASSRPPLTYPYSPFTGSKNHIRLLKYIGLSQDSASARLQFEVLTYECPTGPYVDPFYAVSYSWGEKPELAETILDNHEVAVPFSSELALRGLISAFQNSGEDWDPGIPISIGAIRINQRDIKEREKQLPLMKWTYACAAKVCIWLGPAGRDTITALRSLEILGTEKERRLREHGENAVPPNGVLLTPNGCDWEH